MAQRFSKKQAQPTGIGISQEGMLVEVPKKTKFTLDPDKESTQKETEKFRFPFFQILIGILLTSLLIGAFILWKFVSVFEQASGASATNLAKQIRMGLAATAFEEDGRENFLLLGIDDLESRDEEAELTDTMMIISVQKNGTVSVVSLPRDLWVPTLSVKVNYLYYLGEQTEPGQGMILAEKVVEDITGVSIDHTISVRLALVESLINAVGGVDVSVTKTFTDTKFPRENVDLTSTDPTVLYETVHFEAGENHFDGKMALKYIRSRHSDDLTEGTDIARMRRQQQVIAALAQKISNKELLLNAHTLGTLYKLWDTEVETSLQDSDLISIGKELVKTTINIMPIQIPIQEGENPGILHHPTDKSFKQWVFTPVDPTGQELKDWFQKSL